MTPPLATNGTRRAPRTRRNSGDWSLRVILGFALIAITLVAFGYYRQHLEHVEAAAREELSVIADSKVGRLAQWREVLASDANWILTTSSIRANARDYFAHPTNERARSQLQGWLDSWRQHHHYRRLVLVDARAQPRLASPENHLGMDRRIQALLGRTLQTNVVMMADLHRDEESGQVNLDVLIPLLVQNDPAGPGELAGVLICEIAPEHFLFPSTQSWPTTSRSGETLLVRREGEEVAYLNELRHQTNTALRLRFPLTRRALPAVRAVLGETGVVTGDDYRGVRVLAALRPVPGSPWFIVAKRDLEEIHAPLRRQAWETVAAAVALGLAVALSLVVLWQRREHRYTEQELAGRQGAEAALRASEERFRSLYNSMTEMVVLHEVVTDSAGRPADYRILSCNPAFSQITGIPSERAVGALGSAVYATGEAPFLETYARVAITGEPAHFEAPFPPLQKHFDISVFSPERGQFATVSTDITARQRAELALRASEERFRNVVETAPEAIFIRTRGEFSYLNGAALRLFGATDVQQLLHQPVVDRLQADHREWTRERMRRLDEHQEPTTTAEQVFLRLDGSPVHAIVSAVPFAYAGQASSLVFARDITDRRQAEQALLASEVRRNLALDAARAGTWEWELQTGRNTWSQELWPLYGLAADGCEPSYDAWLRTVHPADRATAERALEAAVSREAELNLEWRTRGPDGGERWLMSRGQPVRNEAGRVTHYLGVVMDITEQKHAATERERLLSDLARKHAELESLIYMASHDLRAPLVNVEGFSQRLATDCQRLVALLAGPPLPAHLRAESAETLERRIRQALKFIHSGVKKMNSLITGQLQISRLGRERIHPERLEMDALIRQLLDAVQYQVQMAGASVTVEPLPACRGDVPLISRVFANLLDNAIKYRDPARPLAITISGRATGGEVVYCVQDNGVGIAADQLEVIWNLFQRLDPEGPVAGEGLGLAFVRRILNRLGGRTWVESTPGQGSRFFVALPAPEPA
jgi:PAS domain S-box-containing protein